MDFVKNINFETNLFSVDAREIRVLKAEKIEKMSNDRIKVVACYTTYFGYLNDTMLKTERDAERVLYLNLSEAQKEQLELRKKVVDNAFERMKEAQDNYNKIISAYFNKPLSNPFKNKPE